jgi:hypothetical protein
MMAISLFVFRLRPSVMKYIRKLLKGRAYKGLVRSLSL